MSQLDPIVPDHQRCNAVLTTLRCVRAAGHLHGHVYQASAGDLSGEESEGGDQ